MLISKFRRLELLCLPWELSIWNGRWLVRVSLVPFVLKRFPYGTVQLTIHFRMVL